MIWMSGRRGRLTLTGALLVGSTVLGGDISSAAGVGSQLHHAHASVHPAASDQRLPVSMCAKQSTKRFATTTVSADGEFFADPVARRAAPRISAAHAYRNFHKAYGPTTRAQDRNTEIRYGRISYVGSGPASSDAIGYVPFLRRTRAWLVTNCVNPSPPASSGGGPFRGSMVVAMIDKAKPGYYEAGWHPAHQTKHNLGGDERSALEPPTPRPRSTPFRSVKWHVVKHEKHGAILLRYHQHACFTFDHLNVEDGSKTDIAVILSSGPGSSCPKPSATAPFVVVKPEPGATIGKLHHLATGPMPYRPESS